MSEKWYSSKEIRDILKISSQCLYNYKKSGQVKTKRISDKKYLYQLPENFDIDRENVIYARVATSRQKNDLNNQLFILKQFTLANGILVKYDNVFTDIGSGLNEERKGLQKLLKKVNNDEVSTIYIAHKDRLTRFGFQYLQLICNLHQTEIVCLDAENEKAFEQELSEDLIDVIHYFSMRFYGKRKNDLKEFEKSLKETEEL